MRTRMIAGSVVMAALLLAPPPARAQQATSGIAGVVRDTSGAVLPGVTVEAASPALIEKFRAVLTDGEGRYSIVALRPGTYTVTFTLVGFNTFRREGVELTAGFTATVNADLRVGALEETVTVTGASPMVDTQNVRQQKVVSDELLTALPSGAKSYSSLARIIPGMNVGGDAGGANGLFMTYQTSIWTRHGMGGSRILFDGMQTQNLQATGQVTAAINPSTVEETTVETGGISAESNNSGTSLNMIPKEGSNVLKFGASGTYTNRHLQAENLPPELAARGFTSTRDILRFYDAHFDVGGPIKQDRVWFFAATRAVSVKNAVPGLYFNKTPGTPFFTPDLGRPAFRLEWDKSQSARVTWQVSPRNKVNGFAGPQSFQARGGASSLQATESSTSFGVWPGGYFRAPGLPP